MVSAVGRSAALLAAFALAWALVPGGLLAGGRPASRLLSSWVELGPGGVALARAITMRDSCPQLLVDGRPAVMQPRVEATGNFPVLTCEATLPPRAAAASVEGQPLPLPKADPRRILVVGDNGCRLKSWRAQACNDAGAWPWPRIAASAAAWQPDLVIHVGDYHYREDPCLPGNSGCAGSPYGQIWTAWNADFFAPAAPLLAAAPWVVVRGNHEDCSRGGAAWFRFLETRPMPDGCPVYTDPYAIPLGGLQLLVLDASAANDFRAAPEQLAAYRPQLATLQEMAGTNAWLLMHPPLWAGLELKEGTKLVGNATLQVASGGQLPPGVKLLVSGHIHLFEGLSFGSALPPQLLVGNGGTFLDDPLTAPVAGLSALGVTAAPGSLGFHRFGFATLEPAGSGWQATLRDIAGPPMAVCDIGERSVQCR